MVSDCRFRLVVGIKAKSFPNTDLLMLREQRLAAIVFANTNGVTPVDFATKILREGLAARNGK